MSIAEVYIDLSTLELPKFFFLEVSSSVNVAHFIDGF